MTKVARLTAGEKLAVSLLRGAVRQGESRAVETAFLQLADHARAAGLRIQEPGCGYLGGDEAKLLAGLTLLQRQRPELLIDVSAALHDDLRACATLLAAAGIRLDYRNMLRASAATHRHPESADIASSAPTTIGDAFSNFAFQAELFRYVNANGKVWFKELQHLGATRHVISTMCKRGLLRRVRHGLYETPLKVD